MREQGLAQAAVFRRGRHLAGLELHLGQQHGAHAAHQVGVAPEELEGLVEQGAVFNAVEHAGAQGGVQVLPGLQTCDLQRLQRQRHTVSAHGHAGVAQHAGEVHDVVGQAARGLARGDHGGLRISASRLAA